MEDTLWKELKSVLEQEGAALAGCGDLTEIMSRQEHTPPYPVGVALSLIHIWLTDRSFGIHLTILKRGEFCIINVANEARQGDPMASYRAGASSKSGHEGIGIASIQARCV